MKKKTILKDLWVVILDIFAVNLSYYMALLIRFYKNGIFHPNVGRYIPDFIQFSPYYTVIAIVIFFFFRMYGGMWRYAGLSDMNRIIGGSFTASAVHVLVTLIFIERMPISYYVIGAALQFVFLALIRFSYRILMAEKKRFKREETIPVLVVGSGDLGRKVIRHLEENTPYRAAAILGEGSGQTMNGIPVVGFDNLERVTDKAEKIFIADNGLSLEQRDRINSTAGDKEIQDFTGALSNMTGAVPVTGLLETIGSRITLVIDGKEKSYRSGAEAISDLHTKYIVTSIKGDRIEIVLKPDDGLAYLRQHAEETGEELSFF